jgi:hypothetical protein
VIASYLIGSIKNLLKPQKIILQSDGLLLGLVFSEVLERLLLLRNLFPGHYFIQIGVLSFSVYLSVAVFLDEFWVG